MNIKKRGRFLAGFQGCLIFNFTWHYFKFASIHMYLPSLNTVYFQYAGLILETYISANELGYFYFIF